MDVTRHGATIRELRKVKGRLLDKLEKDLSRANLENTQAEARAQPMNKTYALRSSGRKSVNRWQVWM